MLETIWTAAWVLVLVVAPIAFCVGLVAMLNLMERDLKIAEKRWMREHGERV
jgi:uncharacterized membrane protein